jgi:hypothetical protein
MDPALIPIAAREALLCLQNGVACVTLCMDLLRDNKCSPKLLRCVAHAICISNSGYKVTHI